MLFTLNYTAANGKLLIIVSNEYGISMAARIPGTGNSATVCSPVARRSAVCVSLDEKILSKSFLCKTYKTDEKTRAQNCPPASI